VCQRCTFSNRRGMGVNPCVTRRYERDVPAGPIFPTRPLDSPRRLPKWQPNRPGPPAATTTSPRPDILPAHPGLAYLRGSAPGGIHVRRSRRSQKKRRGGSGAWTRRTYPPPVQPPNHVTCTGDVRRRRLMGRTPLEDGPSADSSGSSPIQGFAFLIPASSAGARSLLVPGTCDLTHKRTDASDSAVHGTWKGPHIPAP
jgi:hypothetical protein